MSTAVLNDTSIRAPAADPARRSFGRLAAFAAVYTYALIVVGGIVRISGSGLGCGDDWPLCHGQWIPPFTFNTIIEYTHRLLAAGISLVIAAVLVQALRHRARPGFSGPGGLVRPAVLAAGLLVLQVVLGGITVMLGLSGPVTMVHLGTAMAILATLLVTAVRAGAFGGDAAAATPVDAGAARRFRAALTAAGLCYLVVLMGAMTANTGAPDSGAPSAAALACQGFPFCNGGFAPGVAVGDIQLTHRILAYLLFFHVIGAAIVATKRAGARVVSRAAVVALALVVTQVLVAAGMVSMSFPPAFRGTHLAVGAALWSALVVWATLARRAAVRKFPT